MFPIQIICGTLIIATNMIRLLLTSSVFLLLMKWVSTDTNMIFEELNSEVTDMETQRKIASQLIEISRQKLAKDIKKICRTTVCNLPPDCSRCQHCISAEQNENQKTTTFSFLDAISEKPMGDQEALKPLDCSDIYRNGIHADGAYEIWPQGGLSTAPIRVYCDMTTDGGGWTVIQRRGDFGNPDDYFFRKWNDYKTGFGDLLKEFWIGNDNIYVLTNQRSYQLRVDLTSWEDDTAYATYDRFRIEDELNKYKLHVGTVISGYAGDSLWVQNGMAFTTKDQDNDIGPGSNCAERFKGAWWYEQCHYSNLNGLHLKGTDTSGQGMVWKYWRNSYRSLKASEMKIRPADFH